MGKKREQVLCIASGALRAARRCVAQYGSVKSRHDFTQPQLVACLVVRAYLKTTYRGMMEILEISPPLQEALGLKEVPHWTTLQKCAAREGMLEVVGAVLRQIIEDAGLLDVAGEVTADSTGLQIGAASAHYRSRAGKSSVGYVKLSLLVLCGVLMPVSMVADIGPSPDLRQMPMLLSQAATMIRPTALYADKGYDAEWVHEYCREGWGAKSWISPVIRTQDGTIKTPYRAMMAHLPKSYGRRWHIESFFSGLKRSTLSTIAARRHNTMLVEAACKVLAYTLRR